MKVLHSKPASCTQLVSAHILPDRSKIVYPIAARIDKHFYLMLPVSIRFKQPRLLDTTHFARTLQLLQCNLINLCICMDDLDCATQWHSALHGFAMLHAAADIRLESAQILGSKSSAWTSVTRPITPSHGKGQCCLPWL